MASVKKDIISGGVTFTERFGVVTGMTTSVLVYGLTVPSTPDSIAQEIRVALTVAGLDARSHPGGAATNNQQLILTEYTAIVHESDNTKATVSLTYEHGMVGGQVLNPAGGRYPYFTFSGGLTEVETNKYTVAGTDVIIQVGHKYPDGIEPQRIGTGDGTVVTLPADEDWPGQYKVQTGKISVTDHNESIGMEGIVITAEPITWARAIKNKVNSTLFLDASDIGKWKCTRADFTPWNHYAMADDVPDRNANSQWMFSLEFEYNPVGHQPTAVFTDPRSGEPPAGLVEGAGYFEVPYYQTADFLGLMGFSI